MEFLLSPQRAVEHNKLSSSIAFDSSLTLATLVQTFCNHSLIASAPAGIVRVASLPLLLPESNTPIE
jgi:hypothetical protein